MSYKKLFYYILAIFIVGVLGYFFGFITTPVLLLFGLIGLSAILFWIFGRFSKKLAAFLILLLLLGSIIFLLFYFFISNVGNIGFDIGELKGVKIELFSDLQSKNVIICDNKCVISKIPPVNYKIFASKKGYVPYEGSIEVVKGEITNLKFTLKKEITITEIKQNAADKILTIKYNKILDDLKGTKDELNREVLGVYDKLLYSISDTDGNFHIYSYDGNGENEVFSLPGSKISKYFLNRLNGIISYSGGGENHFYDINTKKDYSVKLNRNILNAKSYVNDSRYVINSEDGTYLFNPSNNDLIKNTLFDDFIPVSDTKILGFIKSESKDKLSLLNFSEYNQDILVLHDISTRDKKLVYKFDKDVLHVYTSSSSIFFEDVAGNLYEINELEK